VLVATHVESPDKNMSNVAAQEVLLKKTPLGRLVELGLKMLLTNPLLPGGISTLVEDINEVPGVSGYNQQPMPGSGAPHFIGNVLFFAHFI
jgi:hypothetical protein